MHAESEVYEKPVLAIGRNILKSRRLQNKSDRQIISAVPELFLKPVACRVCTTVLVRYKSGSNASSRSRWVSYANEEGSDQRSTSSVKKM